MVKDDLDEADTKVRPAAVGPKAEAVMLEVAAIKSIVHARPVTFMICGHGLFQVLVGVVSFVLYVLAPHRFDPTEVRVLYLQCN